MIKLFVFLLFFLMYSCSGPQISQSRAPDSKKDSTTCFHIIDELVSKGINSNLSNLEVELASIRLKKILKKPPFKSHSVKKLLKKKRLVDNLTEQDFLKTTSEKIAFLELFIKHEDFGLSSLRELTKEESPYAKKINKAIEGLDFEKGIDTLEIQDLLLALALSNKKNPSKALSLLHMLSGYKAPKEIVYQWYLYNFYYQKNLLPLLGPKYIGSTARTKFKKVRREVFRSTFFLTRLFLSALSATSSLIDIVPFGDIKYAKVPPKTLKRWSSSSFHEIEDELLKELGLRTKTTIGKKIASRAFFYAGIVATSVHVWKNYQAGPPQDNEVIDVQLEATAQAIAIELSKQEHYQNEILSGLSVSSVKKNPELIESARKIWVKNKTEELLLELDSQGINEKYHQIFE